MTFDLSPDLDLTRDLNFEFFEYASDASRRDLPNAASPVSLRPSLFEIAGVSDPTPLAGTGGGGYRTAQAVAG